MQENMGYNGGAKAGTIGGTLLCVLCNIHGDDLVKTALLAALGAVVSFFVSLGLKKMVRRFK